MTPDRSTPDPLDQYARGPLDTDPERLAASRAVSEKMHELFRGRSDAYSIRKVFTDGRPKAFYPACLQKFLEGCQIKKGCKGSPCDNCEARRLDPLTVGVVLKHVLGAHVVGLYLISDGRVRCAAVDFDDHSDGTADGAMAPEDMPIPRGARLVDAGKEIGVPLFLERSGGGKGVHVWCFFRDWVTAGFARKLFDLLLRRAGLPTDVEVFPRQRDTRKFGNLIALPYQDGPDNWRKGRSVFVDPDTCDILDPLTVLNEISESLVSEMQVMKVRKEYGVTDEPASTPAVAPAKTEKTATLVEKPIDAVFEGCQALRAFRDDPPYKDQRHGRGQYQRLALASALRLLPGGTEEIHRIIAEKCPEDYNPKITDSKINSLTLPPITCMRMRTWGYCKFEGACPAIKERGGRSPVVFAYAKGGAPDNVEDSRTEIRITTDQAAMYDAALEALTGHPELYQRGGLLVHVVASTAKAAGIKREVDAPRVEYVPKAWISRSLSDVSQFLKHKGKSGWSATNPEPLVVDQLMTPRYLTGMRYLVGITEAPQQRPDGTLIIDHGYDYRTGLFHSPYDEVLPVADNPTRADALAARDLLLSYTVDFPIDTDAHRGAWLAMILTYFARPAIDGALPLFVIDANVRGAGKSLLAQIASIIMTGREAATIQWSNDDRENKKALTALFIAADPVILFDNVEAMLGGAALNTALTSTVWKDRILGESRDTGRMPIRSLLMATSNNATFGKDTVRRTIHIRLESPYEHPENRTDYTRPRVRDEIQAIRPQLVKAALTILRAFRLSGSNPKIMGMGDYGAWGQIRQAIIWLDLPDPLTTQKTLAEHADTDSNEHRELIEAMKYANPNGDWLTAGQWLERAEYSTQAGFGTAMGYDGGPLRNVLLEYCAAKSGELPSVIKFAGRLCHYRNRIAGGEAIVNRRDVGRNISTWRVEATDKQVDSEC